MGSDCMGNYTSGAHVLLQGFEVAQDLASARFDVGLSSAHVPKRGKEAIVAIS